MAALLAVILTTSVAFVRKGEPVPISIGVRNISGVPLWMVGVVDGSEAGFRFPKYLPSIIGPPPLPPSENLPWCGMVAPLRLEDFRYLEPGQSFDPTVPVNGAGYLPLVTFSSFRPRFTGRYEFALTLSTESEVDEEWLGIVEYPGKEAVLARLALVPRLRVESNRIELEVR